MKSTVITSIIVALCLLIIPFTGLRSGQTVKEAAAGIRFPYSDEAGGFTEDSREVSFRVKTDDGIIELAAEDYLFGVVSAEMSALSPKEALKAQCVAAYSFALYRKASRKEAEYDLTDSYKTDQSYLPVEKLKERWGENYDVYAGNIKAAISEVHGEYLSYGGEPALALYHSLSGGTTNSCKEVFGGDKPYLISVESECDRLSPDYKSVFSLSADELKTKLSSVCNVPAAENAFSEIKTSQTGLVLSLDCGGNTVSGSKIAALLGLPSASFSAEYADGSYTFTCTGRGHGVGMSQYGAEYLAKGGASYKEILNHYYPGTTLKP